MREEVRGERAERGAVSTARHLQLRRPAIVPLAQRRERQDGHLDGEVRQRRQLRRRARCLRERGFPSQWASLHTLGDCSPPPSWLAS
jgi:hypothetical protein